MGHFIMLGEGLETLEMALVGLEYVGERAKCMRQMAKSKFEQEEVSIGKPVSKPGAQKNEALPLKSERKKKHSILS